jgi:hypothetical protein
MNVRSMSRKSLLRKLVTGITTLAFAVLVSVAATHLHVGADTDDGCAVCAAVIGKLEGPGSPPLVVAAASVDYVQTQFRAAPRLERSFVVVLPPACGPPYSA